MSEKLVTVARFDTPFEARIAKNRLEAEGIPAFLGDEESVGNLWHLGMALGGVKLLVSDDHIQKAMDLLTALPEDEMAEADHVSDKGETDAEAIQEAWTCPECGNRVTADQGFCTYCSSSGDDPDEATLTSPENASGDAAVPEDDSDLPLPFLGDEIAFRALKAAAFSLLFVPLVFYSCWLLFRLFTFPGDLSPQGTRNMLGAMVLDFVVLIVLLALFSFYW
jgi:hypothetical protein